MAALLKDLIRDLNSALENGDRERAAATRRSIAEQHSDSDAGAEAAYKLGLDLLFFEADLDRAAEQFRAASKSKTPWASSARVSLGMVLFRQGKPQQAVFELRKVAGQKPPTIASAQALALISGFLRLEKNAVEADRARSEEMKLLEQLTKSATPEEAALANYLLGLELKLEGRRDRAKKHLDAALAGALDATFAHRARALLAEL